MGGLGGLDPVRWEADAEPVQEAEAGALRLHTSPGCAGYENTFSKLKKK